MRRAAAGGGGGRAPRSPGRVWILAADGKLKPVQLTLGISDGQSTEILRGELKEGQEIIVGALGAPAPGSAASRTAAPTPAQPGGGPRLRREPMSS